MVRERGARRARSRRARSQVVAEQDHVGGADRDVGAGAEGEPEVGGGERGAVVDAVADHRHPVAARPQPGDDGRLAGRQRPGDDLVDARRGGDRPRGRLVVPGQQDRVQPERAQFGDGGGGRGLDRVGDRDGAADGAVPADQHRGAARLLPLAALPGQVGRHGHPVLGQQPRAPDDDLAAVDGAARAEPGQRPERLGPRQRAALPPRGRADRGRDRVLGRLLDRARVPQQVGAADAVGRPHAGQLHPAGGDRPGLVEDDHVDRPRRFQRLVLLDEYPVAGAAARTPRPARPASPGRARTGRR